MRDSDECLGRSNQSNLSTFTLASGSVMYPPHGVNLRVSSLSKLNCTEGGHVIGLSFLLEKVFLDWISVSQPIRDKGTIQD